MDFENYTETDFVPIFDPIKRSDDKNSQVIWTTETVVLAKNGLLQGLKLTANPFNMGIKGGVLFRKANIPFKMTPEEEEVYRMCFNDKKFFGNNLVSLKDGDKGWKRITLRDYQEKLLDSYDKNRWNIVMYPRQSGKTTTTAIEIVHYLTFNIDKDVVVIAQSDISVNEILSKIKEIFNNLPFFMQPGFISFTANGCILDNGCRLRIGVASESVTQGLAVDVCYIDEFAYIPHHKVAKFWNNIYPTLANNPNSKCIITSTPNGRNLFWELWTNATNKKNKFVTNRIYWTDVPGRDEQFKRDTIANVGLEGWLMGFECSFDTQLSSIFRTQTQVELRRLQQAAEPNGEDEGYWSVNNHPIGAKYNIKFLKQEQCAYNLKEDYFMIGVDISEGLEQDYTTIKIKKLCWDKENKKIYYRSVGVFENNQISVEDFAELTAELFGEFSSEKIRVVVDLTNYGNEYFAHINKLKLYNPKYYTLDNSIFAKFESNTKQDYETGLRWNKSNKKIGVRALTGLVSSGEFIEDHFNSIEEYLNFGRNKNNDSYSAQYGYDDLIMADVSLAYFIRSNNLYFNEFIVEAEYHLRSTLLDYTEEQKTLLEEQIKNINNYENNGYTIRNHSEHNTSKVSSQFTRESEFFNRDMSTTVYNDGFLIRKTRRRY